MEEYFDVLDEEVIFKEKNNENYYCMWKFKIYERNDGNW